MKKKPVEKNGVVRSERLIEFLRGEGLDISDKARNLIVRNGINNVQVFWWDTEVEEVKPEPKPEPEVIEDIIDEIVDEEPQG